jgi:hypothetical protein
MQGQDFPTDIGNAKESSIKETKLEAKPLFDVLILFLKMKCLVLQTNL